MFTIQILLTSMIGGALLFGVGSFWNMSVNREPYLTISGVIGIFGVVMVTISLTALTLGRIWGFLP